MSEKRIFIDSLTDILNEIDRIFKFVSEITYDEFIHDGFSQVVALFFNLYSLASKVTNPPEKTTRNSSCPVDGGSFLCYNM